MIVVLVDGITRSYMEANGWSIETYGKEAVLNVYKEDVLVASYRKWDQAEYRG